MSTWVDLPFSGARAFLLRKRVLTREAFDDLLAEERQLAFTVTGVNRMDVLQHVLDSLGRAVGEGTTLADFAENLDEVFSTAGLDPLTPWRAETVFRTGVQSAYGRGRWEQITDPDIASEVFGWRYLTVGDDRVREEHAQLEGVVFRTGEGTGFFPPWDFNSILPTTPVAGNFRAASKAWYSGKAVELTTHLGYRASVTANHPVLTPKGFVLAQNLHEGDRAICDGSGVEREEGLSLRPEKQDRPSTAEQVFEALRKDWPVSVRNVVSENLHGHEVVRNRYIETVRPDRPLLVASDSSFADRVRNFAFSCMNVDKKLMTDASAMLALFLRRLSSANGLVGGGGLAFAGLPIHAGPFQKLGGGAATNRYTFAGEPLVENRPADAELVRKPLGRQARGVESGGVLRVEGRRAKGRSPEHRRFGRPTHFDAMLAKNPSDWNIGDSSFARQLATAFPGQVSADEIVLVREFDFVGHVYDFTADTSLIVSDNIALSNCRCSSEIVLNSEAEAEGISETRSVPPESFAALSESDFTSPAVDYSYRPDLTGFDAGLVNQYLAEKGDRGL